MTPEVVAAVTAAQATWVTEAPVESPLIAPTDALAVTPVALPELVPSAVNPATAAPLAVDPAEAATAATGAQDAAPGHHLHRHLLQAGNTSTKEWISPWPFLVSRCYSQSNPKSH